MSQATTVVDVVSGAAAGQGWQAQTHWPKTTSEEWPHPILLSDGRQMVIPIDDRCTAAVVAGFGVSEGARE